jgi:hypothetical protein
VEIDCPLRAAEHAQHLGPPDLIPRRQLCDLVGHPAEMVSAVSEDGPHICRASDIGENEAIFA